MKNSKQLRLNRIFGIDNRSVVIAMDHGIAGLSPLEHLEDPGRLIPEVIAGGADALIMTPGMVKAYGHLIHGSGVILRIDAGATAQSGNWDTMEVMLQMEDAARMGVDAVILMGATGVDCEAKSLSSLGKIAARCDDWGIPVIGEMLPGGFAAKEVTLEQLKVAARLGAELGVDVVKIRFQGPANQFCQVVEACYVPVLVLGGSRQPPERLIVEIRQAMEAGAAGVAIGRNVWQSPAPREMVGMIREAVHSK